MRPRETRRTARRACVVLAGTLGLGLLTTAAASADDHKVVICHATNADDNPYNLIEVATSAAANGHSHDLEDDAGELHGGHGDDIVPPFTYTQGGEDQTFEGWNWDAEGQAIWQNGCQAPQPTLEVAVIPENVCLGDEVTVVLDNTGSDVEVTFAGTLTDPDGGTTTLEEAVAAGESGQLAVTPETTGTFTYAYTATAEGADPVTGEVSFVVEDCEEVTFDVVVTTDAAADGVCVGDDVTITLDNTGSNVPAEFTLVGATGEGEETLITRTVAAGEVETITRTPELGSYELDWTASADGVDEDLGGQVAYDVIDCTTEVEPDIECPDGTTEVDGECVVDTTEGDEVVCPEGSSEVDGECVADTTEGDEVTCPEGSSEVDGDCVVDTTVGGEVDERDTVDEPDAVDGDVAVRGEMEEQPRVERVVAEGGADTEVRGVTQAAGVAAAGQLPVTGAATVPLLVVFGLLNLLFGVRLRRYGLRTRQQR